MRLLLSLVVALAFVHGTADAQCVPPGARVVYVAPIYPADALALRIQGVVILRWTVAIDGTVADVTVTRALWPSLDAAAVAAILQWRYAVSPAVTCPLVINGTVLFTLPIETNPPTNLQAAVSGNVLGLNWTAPSASAPTQYLLEAGTASGLANLATVPLTPVSTSFSAAVPNGTYFLRMRASYPSGPSAPSNEVQVTVGCSVAPPTPTGFAHTVGPGGAVHFSWSAPATAVAAYQLEAGASQGSAGLAIVPLPGSATSFDAVAPPGVYFVRLRARNACGTSAATSEAVVSVGTACVPPSAPVALTVTANGGVLGASWSPPTSGTGPFTYVVKAGSASGVTNLGTFPVGAVTSIQAPVPPAAYFLRVAAMNACGTSPDSNEASAVVTP